MAVLETVRVKHPSLGYVIINKADFDPSKHEVEVPAPAPAPAPVAAPPSSEPGPAEAIKAELRKLNIEDFTIALLNAPDLAAVALAEEAENGREGGPRKGALRAIADRRAELEAQG